MTGRLAQVALSEHFLVTTRAAIRWGDIAI